MDRFISKFVVEDFIRPGMITPCWRWIAYTDNNGYGRFSLDGRCAHASRVAYELWIGPIPDSLVIDHLCCHHACVNPEHMEPVTRVENIKRGSELGGKRRQFCRYGHPIDAIHGGRKRCSQCAAEYSRRYRERIG